MKTKLILFLVSLLAAGTLLGVPKVEADAVTEKTWQLSNLADFDVHNSDKVRFSNGSVKIIPTGIANGGYKIWHDTNFSGKVGSSYIYALTTDSSGNYFLGGDTCSDGAATECYAFIVKLDQNFNQIWYKRYFDGLDPVTYGPIYYPPDGLGPNGDTGFNDLAFSPSGDLIAYGLQMETTPTATAKIQLFKINPANGEIVWQKTRTKPHPWVSTYDEANGPIFDKDGNFFIDYGVGCGPNYQAGPMEIAKYNTNGDELWSVVDDPVAHRTGCQDRPMQEDYFQSVVDSEGSYYVSSSYWAAGGWTMNFMLTKYDKDGNFKWRDTKYMDGGGWASPRGLSIDSSDHLYIHGNTSAGDWNCGVRVLDKNGNVIVDKKLITDPPLFNYCETSKVDEFDRVAIAAPRDDDWKAVNVAFFNTSLNLLAYNTFSIAEANSGIGQVASSYLDQYSGHILNLIEGVSDKRYANAASAVVAINTSTYPNTLPAAGDTNIIYLTNKTPQSYTTLNGFTVGYGTADQADVKFQVSNNGTTWYYWNGSDWMQAVGYENSTAADVNSNISKFSDKFGPGQFYFKAFMLTDGTKQVDLASVKITHDLPISTTLSVLPATGGDALGDPLSRLLANIFIKIEKILIKL